MLVGLVNPAVGKGEGAGNGFSRMMCLSSPFGGQFKKSPLFQEEIGLGFHSQFLATGRETRLASGLF